MDFQYKRSYHSDYVLGSLLFNKTILECIPNDMAIENLWKQKFKYQCIYTCIYVYKYFRNTSFEELWHALYQEIEVFSTMPRVGRFKLNKKQ